LKCCEYKQSKMFCNNKLQWTGFLLSLILSTQYIHIAGHVHFHQNEDGENAVCVRSFENEDTCPLQKPKEKRLVLAILFAISIFATLANLAFDLYLQIKGCCGIFPVACTYRDEFNVIKDDLKKRADTMNDDYTVCTNLLEYIRGVNQNNQDIWAELLRIMVLQKRIITTLDTEILNKYNNKSTELKIALEGHNRTIAMWGEAEITTDYNGVFSSVKTAAIGLAPLVGMLGFAAIKSGIQWYKGYKIAQTVKSNAHLLSSSTKASKVLGVSSVNTYVKGTVNAQTKAVSAASKMSKFAKFASGAMSVVAIGLEIYMAIQKVKACETVRDNAKNARDTLKPEQAKFKVTEDQLVEFEANLTQSYGYAKGNVSSDVFLNHTMLLKKLAQGADVQPDDLKAASVNIQKFHDSIRGANKDATINLQKSLITAMKSIEYTWDCFDKKISTVTYVYDHCKRGTNTLNWLFTNAAKSFLAFSNKCTNSLGHTYVTFAETDTYVSGRMDAEGYLKDCILNNVDVRLLVCSQYAQDYPNAEIASMNELTLIQANYIISKCPPASVTPMVATLICAENFKHNLAATKTRYHKYNQDEVTTTYNNCPPPVLPDLMKKEICFYKNSGYKEAETISKYSQYNSALVQSQYRACKKEMSPDTKEAICTAKKFAIPLADIQEGYKELYTAAEVEAAYNACP